MFCFLRFPNFPPRRVWSSSPTALLKGIVHLGSGPLKAWSVGWSHFSHFFCESSCRVNHRFSMIFTSLVTYLLSGKVGLVGENLCQNFWRTIEFEAWNVHHKHGHVLVESGGNFAGRFWRGWSMWWMNRDDWFVIEDSKWFEVTCILILCHTHLFECNYWSLATWTGWLKFLKFSTGSKFLTSNRMIMTYDSDKKASNSDGQ